MTPRVVPPGDALADAAALLRSGGLVAFPTETVYGLGAHAFDTTAVARIFEAKQRPHFDPLIVHVASVEQISDIVSGDALEAPVTRELVARFWPGPLTLILPKSPAVPGIVTSGLDTVAVRVPQHPVAHELLSLASVPVAAPSANPFGQLSPTRAAHVVEGLGDAVDLIVDGGATAWGVESTIVDVSGERPAVLRFGAVSLEQLIEVVGAIDVQTTSSSAPQSPGQLSSHYAPRTPLRVVERGHRGRHEAAYVAWSTVPDDRYAVVEVLSQPGDLREAAARLFDVLHDLDRAGVPEILVERVPDEGLGRAINDRLRRASSGAH